MDIPKQPPVGSLISYEYVWFHQDRDDGEKARPCVVIGAFAPENPGEDGREHVIVLPVSHSPPREGQTAVALPRAIKRVFKMMVDPESWVYLDDANLFRWSGSDVRPAGRFSALESAQGSCVIGDLPEDWFADLRKNFVELNRAGKVKLKDRSERTLRTQRPRGSKLPTKPKP